jgi:hypothetical protein
VEIIFRGPKWTSVTPSILKSRTFRTLFGSNIGNLNHQ